jgi:cytochrome c biogenesis protein CcdA
MPEWLIQIFDSSEYSLIVLPASILLGFAASVSNCCNVAVVGAITGFSGSRENTGRGTIVVTGLSFMVGTILALGVLGAVAGFISQVAATSMGKYWKLFAGLAAVLFGLVSFGVAPFKMPSFGGSIKPGAPQSLWGAALFGIAVGGAASACAVGCNPLLATVLGITVIKGQTLWGMAILGLFAIGYSLPMTMVLVGLTMGKAAFLRSETVSKVIRYAAGAILVAVGFYFLATV